MAIHLPTQPKNMPIRSEKILWIFSERVKEERKKNNITQEQLAAYIGVSTDTIKRIENGKGVKLDVAYMIAAALRVPFESLLPKQDFLPKDELAKKIHDAQDTLQLLLEKIHE